MVFIKKRGSVCEVVSGGVGRSQLRRPLLVPLLRLLLMLLLLLAKCRPKRAWMPPRLAALPADGEGRVRDISG